ncbi:MAG TPA: hypothetical protein VJ761_13100 [Ktedonobacteraceae bacterium]|nr:hypothetical protein [Ktedonobacteraceae bacterium]
MTSYLAEIVAGAALSSVSLIGLAKNVGKTTTTNHLLETLLAANLYRAPELSLTSLGLDGEAIDALTGLPKPRYMPQPRLVIATAAELLRQAENEGIQAEYLLQLPGRTALGPVVLARILQPGRVVIAGPTMLRELRNALDKMQGFGSRLCIVDGAINRLGAASPGVTDACIVCTGASVAGTPGLVARRTVDTLRRLTTQKTQWRDAYEECASQARLLMFPTHNGHDTLIYAGSAEPMSEAAWIVAQMGVNENATYFLNGALTEELARALLAQLSPRSAHAQGELIVGDATKIFCHSVVLQRLAGHGLVVHVAHSINILALTLNPFTPEYTCTPQQLLEALLKELPRQHPPIIDVVSGLYSDGVL